MSIEAKEKLARIMGTFDLATGHGDTIDELLDALESELRDVLGYYRQMRTWVGLTDDEVERYWDWEDFQTGAGRSTIFEMVRDIEAKLKERNA